MYREPVGAGGGCTHVTEKKNNVNVPDFRGVVCVALLTCRHVSPNEDDVEESHGPSGEDDAQA